MNIISVPFLGKSVGNIWMRLQNKQVSNENFYIAAPLSSTPLPIYHWVIEHSDEYHNWQKFRFVLMDELINEKKPPFTYISLNNPASFESFANKNFLSPLSKKVSLKLEVLKPDLSDLNSFHPPLDLLILALGIKGNYANVMPGTTEQTGWHIAHLIPEYLQTHTKKGSLSYEGAHFSEFGMSLGPQQVIQAKHVIVIINGVDKRELTKQFLAYTAFDETFPLSIIHHLPSL